MRLCDGWVFIENHCSRRGTSVTGSMKVRFLLRRSSAVKVDMFNALEQGGEAAVCDNPGMYWLIYIILWLNMEFGTNGKLAANLSNPSLAVRWCKSWFSTSGDPHPRWIFVLVWLDSSLTPSDCLLSPKASKSSSSSEILLFDWLSGEMQSTGSSFGSLEALSIYNTQQRKPNTYRYAPKSSTYFYIGRSLHRRRRPRIVLLPTGSER